MKKLLLVIALCLVAAVLALPCASHARSGGGHGGGGHAGYGGHGGYGGHAGYYGGGHAGYYGGGHYGGYGHYYYRGHVPGGAIVGSFLGGVVVGGILSPFWYPYYAVPVPPAYYDPYYQYPSSAPPYVIEVPPNEATTAYPQQAGQAPPMMAPNQCYAPQMDQSGNIVKDNEGNMIPDFSKAVPCPPQS